MDQKKSKHPFDMSAYVYGQCFVIGGFDPELNSEVHSPSSLPKTTVTSSKNRQTVKVKRPKTPGKKS